MFSHKKIHEEVAKKYNLKFYKGRGKKYFEPKNYTFFYKEDIRETFMQIQSMNDNGLATQYIYFIKELSEETGEIATLIKGLYYMESFKNGKNLLLHFDGYENLLV